MTKDQALNLREVLVKGADSLDDKTISTAPMACRRMKYDGSLIQNGTRIYWPEDDLIYKNGSDLWDREEFNPKNSPDLWTPLDYIDGIRAIPEEISYTLRFALDELGWWENAIYKSLKADNVYNPSVRPEDWELQKKG